MTKRSHQYSLASSWLARLICAGTVLLIFAGGVVTSKNVGLSVPDWPTSFGYHMWTMPWSMWKGGVFYEHSHRVIASGIGCLMIGMTVWLVCRDARRHVRNLSWLALVLVCVQGVLGGMTVRYQLPVAVSTSHGVVAQLFFCLTIILVYVQSHEWFRRNETGDSGHPRLCKWASALLMVIFIQLMLAAFMRHDMKHQGGVSVPDFPTVAGRVLPLVDEESVSWVNQWRQDAVWEHGEVFDLTEPVRRYQITVHVLHRIVAGLILIGFIALTVAVRRMKDVNLTCRKTLYVLDALVATQVILGALTVWSNRGEFITSFHVVTGAALLGTTMLLVLRTRPVRKLGTKA